MHANDGKHNDFPEKERVIELVTQHYKNLTLYQELADSKEYFKTWVNSQKGSILVSGSFSRSAISEFFNKSFVIDILKDHKLPVFIAHK